jgi:hypothetical protein
MGNAGRPSAAVDRSSAASKMVGVRGPEDFDNAFATMTRTTPGLSWSCQTR